MLNPFINLISNVIFLINLAVILWAVLSLLLHFDIVNRSSPLVMRLYSALDRLCEPLLRPFRKVQHRVFPGLAIDFSPIILILLLNFLDNALYTWFYRV